MPTVSDGADFPTPPTFSSRSVDLIDSHRVDVDKLIGMFVVNHVGGVGRDDCVYICVAIVLVSGVAEL